MAAGMVPPLAMALASTVRPGPVHRAGAGERPGGLASRRVVHLRGRDPVRRGRPAAGHPVDDVRRRRHRRADHGVRRDAARRRTAASSCSSPSATCCGSSSRWPAARSSPRSPSSPPSSSSKPGAKARPQTPRAGHRLIRTINPTDQQGEPHASKTVTVGSAIGLHARPAAIIAEAVVNAGVPVTLSVDGGEPVDAGSALMIMTLGAGNGAQVTVAVRRRGGAQDRSPSWSQQDLDA